MLIEDDLGRTARPGVETLFVTPYTILLFAASRAVSSSSIDPSTKPLTTSAPCSNALMLFELCNKHTERDNA